MIARFLQEATFIHDNREEMEELIRKDGFSFPFFYLKDRKAKFLTDGKPGNWFVKKFLNNTVIFCCSFSHDLGYSMRSNNLKIVAKSIKIIGYPNDAVNGPASYEEKFGEPVDIKNDKEKAKKYAIGAREAVKKLSKMTDLKSAVDLLWKLTEESTK